MTTIAATKNMIAADSRVTIGDTSYLSPKLVIFPDAIVGAAGDTEACHLFFEWWPNRQTAKLKIPKDLEDMDALVLTREGLYIYHKYGKPDLIKDGIGAVGTGSAIAMASLDTMIKLGMTPDPRIAVEMACKRNPDSCLPVDHYTLEQLDGASDKKNQVRKVR